MNNMDESAVDDKSLTIRRARASDVDDITNVIISVFDESHVYNYCFTGAKQYPDDYATYTRARTAEYLANVDSGAYIGTVAEAVEGEERKRVVVGYSFWQLAGHNTRTASKPAISQFERRDANFARIEAVRATTKKARAEWFESKYGNQQNFLVSMAVRSDFRRRGIAAEMVRSGLADARKQGVPVTLCASVMGALLYSHLGFVDMGRSYVQLDGKARGMKCAVWFMKKP